MKFAKFALLTLFVMSMNAAQASREEGDTNCPYHKQGSIAERSQLRKLAEIDGVLGKAGSGESERIHKATSRR